MEIKERTAKTGKNAGKTYFFVEKDGTTIASYDKEAITEFIEDPTRVDLKELNGWYWARRLEQNTASVPQPRTSSNNQRLDQIIGQLIDELIKIRDGGK